jgi:hypothetical protein
LTQDSNFIYGRSTISGSGTIARVSKSTFALQTDFFEGSVSNALSGTDVSVAILGTNLYLGQGSSLRRYSTVDGSLLGTFSSQNGSPLAVVTDSTHVYFSTDGGRVVKLTPNLDFVLLSVSLSGGGTFGPYPRTTVLRENGNFLYTGGQNQQVRKLDKSTLEIVANAPTFSSFFAETVSSMFVESNRILVALQRATNNFTVLNASDLSLITQFTSTNSSNATFGITTNGLKIFLRTSGNQNTQSFLRQHNYDTYAFEEEILLGTTTTGGGFRLNPITD